jgi:transcriptional regulator with PAS, ATPase and Fis domain
LGAPVVRGIMSSPWRARFSFDDIEGRSSLLKQTITLAQRAAKGEYPVLLVGESGTGKELFAHAIHNASVARDGPFVAVNCGTLCGDIAVAELCGYEPGSFTGADRHTRVGFLDAANGGTLFLDELQDLPATPQSVLLRFLETGSFIRVGATRPVQSTVRVIGASSIRVKELESTGRIRSDLLYRLNCVMIEIAPLRERRDDLRPIGEKCLRQELHYLGEVDEGVWQALESCSYPWPGNLRELRNVLLKTILASSHERLMPGDLPRELWNYYQKDEIAPELGKGSDAADEADSTRLAALKAVLEASSHNVSETARRLGIHRSTVYRRLARAAK